MYSGRIVERAPVAAPVRPTRSIRTPIGLLGSIPQPAPGAGAAARHRRPGAHAADAACRAAASRRAARSPSRSAAARSRRCWPWARATTPPAGARRWTPLLELPVGRRGRWRHERRRRRCCAPRTWSSISRSASGLFGRADRRGARGGRRELRARAPARRWRWSANRAAASRRVGRLVLRLLEPTSGKVWFDGEDLMALSPPELRAQAARAADDLPGPVLVAQSAHDGGADAGRAAGAARAARRAGIASARPSCWTWSAWRPSTRSAIRTSSPAASGSASASRARSRSSRG